MANDVKALPEQRVSDASSYASAFTVETRVVPLDVALSAIAEMRAEVERLSARVRDLLDQRQESAEKHSAYHDRLMNHIEQLMSRADTAEARLERARGLIDLASQHVKSNARLKNAIDAFLGEGK